MRVKMLKFRAGASTASSGQLTADESATVGPPALGLPEGGGLGQATGGKGMRKVPSLLFDMEMEAEGSHHGASSDGDLEAAKRRLQFLAAPSSPLELSLLGHMRAETASAERAGQPFDAARLAERLRDLGLGATARTALGGGGGRECLRNLRHTFVVCTVQGCGSYILDPTFREQFRVAHPTPRYAALLDSLPAEFCGSESRVEPLVHSLCAEMKEAFEETDTTLPPWRCPASMLSKWRPRRSMDITAPAPIPANGKMAVNPIPRLAPSTPPGGLANPPPPAQKLPPSLRSWGVGRAERARPPREGGCLQACLMRNAASQELMLAQAEQVEPKDCSQTTSALFSQQSTGRPSGRALSSQPSLTATATSSGGGSPPLDIPHHPTTLGYRKPVAAADELLRGVALAEEQGLPKQQPVGLLSQVQPKLTPRTESARALPTQGNKLPKTPSPPTTDAHKRASDTSLLAPLFPPTANLKPTAGGISEGDKPVVAAIGGPGSASIGLKKHEPGEGTVRGGLAAAMICLAAEFAIPWEEEHYPREQPRQHGGSSGTQPFVRTPSIESQRGGGYAGGAADRSRGSSPPSPTQRLAPRSETPAGSVQVAGTSGSRAGSPRSLTRSLANSVAPSGLPASSAHKASTHSAGVVGAKAGTAGASPGAVDLSEIKALPSAPAIVGWREGWGVKPRTASKAAESMLSSSLKAGEAGPLDGGAKLSGGKIPGAGALPRLSFTALSDCTAAAVTASGFMSGNRVGASGRQRERSRGNVGGFGGASEFDAAGAQRGLMTFW